MHFATRSTLIASSCLCLGAWARPAPAASYSVVDVDGGSETSTPDVPPTTVFQTITKSSGAHSGEATTVTVVDAESGEGATVQAGERSSTTTSSTSSAEPTTATTTSIPAATSISTAPVPPKPNSTILTSLTTSLSTETHVTSTIILDEKTITLFSAITATPTPSLTTTSYYDDGMWHTSYAIKPSAVVAAQVENAPYSLVVPQWNHSVSSLPTATGARVYPRVLATGTGAVYPRQLATGTGDIYPRQMATETAVAIYPRVAATGTAPIYPRVAVATGAADGAEEKREIVPTGVPTGMIGRALVPTGVPTGLIARAFGTVAAIDERTADTATGLAGRAVPTAYNVVSWNETSLA